MFGVELSPEEWAAVVLVPRLEKSIGTLVRILVSARDVMLSIGRPEGVSALNVLPGEVVEIGEAQGAWLERLRCGEAYILSHVTRKSATDLSLIPGRKVYAMIKSVTFEADRVGTLLEND